MQTRGQMNKGKLENNVIELTVISLTTCRYVNNGTFIATALHAGSQNYCHLSPLPAIAPQSEISPAISFHIYLNPVSTYHQGLKSARII